MQLAVATETVTSQFGTELERKSAYRPLMQLKANTPAREVEGYASTWDPDEIGDTIEKGAFTRTLQEKFIEPMRENGRPAIRVLWQHEDPLGVLLAIREDDKGLYIKARISHTKLGDDALQLLADGAVDRMSIGYAVKDYQALPGGKRLLKDLDLWEVSFVTFPANSAAIISGVKRMGGGIPEIEFRASTF